MWSRLRAYVKARRLLKLLILLAVAVGVAGYALLSVNAIPKHFQYLWPAPAQQRQPALPVRHALPRHSL